MKMSTAFQNYINEIASGKILFLDKWMSRRYIRRTLTDGILTELNEVKRV